MCIEWYVGAKSIDVLCWAQEVTSKIIEGLYHKNLRRDKSNLYVASQWEMSKNSVSR